MVKRTAALDSAHQIGLSTFLEDVLIVVGDSSSGVQKKAAKSETSSGIPQQPAIVMGNGLQRISRAK